MSGSSNSEPNTMVVHNIADIQRRMRHSTQTQCVWWHKGSVSGTAVPIGGGGSVSCLRNAQQATLGSDGRNVCNYGCSGFVCVFVHVCIHKLLLHGLNDYIRAGLIGCLYAWLQHQWARMHPDGLWVILESGQTVCLSDSLAVLCDTGFIDINREEAKIGTER